MIREPKTLRHLKENADEGYATSVFGVTVYENGETIRTKVGGFKKVNDYLYQWWNGRKWVAVDSSYRKVKEYFVIDASGYQSLSGEKLTIAKLEKFKAKESALAFIDVLNSRKFDETEYFKYKIEVKVYKDTRKMDHASDIYQSLETSVLLLGTDACAPEFTTGGIGSIADMVAVTDDKIEVFEIKSKADTFKRLEKQITDYRTYAEMVWLVIDHSLVKKLQKYTDKNPKLMEGIGIITYADGLICWITQAKPNKPTIDAMGLLWSIEKEKILIGLGMPYSSTNKGGDRTNRIKNACLMNEQRHEKLARSVLVSRIKKFFQGKHPSNPGMNIRDCAGEIPLSCLYSIVYGEAGREKFAAEHNQETSGCTV